MATRRGNILHATSTGVVTSTPTKVAHIIFTGTSSGDSVSLKDASLTGNVMVLKVNPTNSSIVVDLSAVPAFFPNGVEVAAISSSCSVTMITTQGGAT